jgi:membrane fusion protein (multidrug efflux system)
VGALVNASSVLTTVSNISQMEVYFSMTEKEALAMSKSGDGLQALPAVKLQLSDGTIYGHEGKVAKMSGVIDAATGTVQMIAVFPNPERLLKSGGSGAIVIPSENSSAIVIPQSCVMEVQNKKFVYLFDSRDKKVNYTEIKVAPQNDGNNYVVTDGLKPGDQYVTNGLTKLKDQMEIVPITPERYEKKIGEQVKEMSASDIVNSMKK